MDFSWKSHLWALAIDRLYFYDVILFNRLSAHIKKSLTEKHKMYIIIRRALTRHVFVRKLS
jgi:hypothetical protein